MSRRSPSGSPSQWNATLAPRPCSTWRSTQLYETFSVPPRNHFAYGGSHSYNVENGSNHETRSVALRAQNDVEVLVVDRGLGVRLRGELRRRRIAPLLEEQRVDRHGCEVVRVVREVLGPVVR